MPKCKREHVVYTTGVWDLLHVGHINHLRIAKSLGNRLVVGIISDKLASTYKPKPILSQELRRKMIMAVKYVDDTVFVHNWDEDMENSIVFRVTLRAFSPPAFCGPGRDIQTMIASQNCIDSVIIPRLEGISTSAIIERIQCVK